MLRSWGLEAGIRFAIEIGMMALPTPRTRNSQRVQWLHRLFVKGALVLSCDIDVRGDGRCAATLFPLWAPEEHVTEMFTRSDEAMRWHGEMMQRLQAAGWLLLEGRAVTSAA
jgi:hypothetical protein